MKPKNWIASRMANDGISKADIAYAIRGTCFDEVEVEFDEACKAHQSVQFVLQLEDIVHAVQSSFGAGIAVFTDMRGYLLGVCEAEPGEDIEDIEDRGIIFPILRFRDKASAIAAGEAIAPMLMFLAAAPLFCPPEYHVSRGRVETILAAVGATGFSTDAFTALSNRDIKDGPYCVGDSIWISTWCPMTREKTPEGVLLAEVAALCMGHFKDLINNDVIGQMCLPYANDLLAASMKDDLIATLENGEWEEISMRAENVLEHMRGPVRLRGEVAPRKLTVAPRDRPAQVAGWRYIPALRAAQSEYCRVLFFDPSETLPEQGKLLPVAGKDGQKWLAWLDPDFGASQRLDADERKVAVLHAADTFLYRQWE